ncbi:hypothetical protein K435DRAFT_854719 [Dendrothele bispora CBS 962.96]|uniref:Uncharacterized protein n=1 Tax=Dendrothele bispora (strain CBS 962.96) TaxID=1314807 RepID=A0A4V4HGX3_DENBC|nr:hypothetical protein K435DRAFT_854719 [Dendrothele bispora CBS 962.96]
MTANVTLILDSQDLGGAVEPGNNTLGSSSHFTQNNNLATTYNSFYQGSLLFFNFTYEMEYIIKFDGSSVLLFGYALGEVSKNFTVDGSLVQPNTLSQNSNNNNSDLPAGGQFPSSPFQGRISGVQQMSIDYALVTATNTSNLEDKTIFVDDDDAEITWSGWTRQADRVYDTYGVTYVTVLPGWQQLDSRIIKALPHGKSVHQSNTSGDSFLFKFAGKSILVAGFTPGSEQGHGALTMTFDVDGNSTSKSYFTPDYEPSLHFVYFSNPDLPAGNHTLTVTIHSVSGNISAYIDYITYKPTFNTLIDKPDFSRPDPAPISNPDPNPSGSHDSVAVKVGATIGSLLLVTILVASLWFFSKRRQKRERRLQGINEGMIGYMVEPFTMPISEANLHMALGRKGTGENLRSIITTQDVLTHRPVSVPMQPLDSAFNIIPPSSAMPASESPAAIAARMRGMEAQMELMSREMQQHIVAPPTYQSEWSS